MTFKAAVLSIDGGGIKGIVPAIILKEIEYRTQKRIHELFDLIAGTSTGGILALGLTVPISDEDRRSRFTSAELVNFYKEEGKIIFQRRPEEKQSLLEEIKKMGLNVTLPKIAPNVTNPEDLFSPKYTRIGKIDVIKKKFEDTIIQKALTEVLITSYCTNLRMPFLFTSNLQKEEEYKQENFRIFCQGYTMQQAAMATSAAPTYFRPYVIRAIARRDPDYTLVDGGVIANNPTSLAIIEVINSYKMRGENLNLNDILVVSLGTGVRSRKLEFQEINNWGQVKWVEPLINITLSGQSEIVDYQMEQLLSAKNTPNKQYYRFQPQFPDFQTTGTTQDTYTVNDAMDDTTESNISSLEKVTAEFIFRNNNSLNSLCNILKNH
ncbi:MAG: patatin-like phospholipase family protein [Nostoc sp. GBBB01]|nr:patatin-like phospholipase family protein [Nostoc sp. GBBB01]